MPVTITGLNELRQAVQKLEPALTAELKRVAGESAERIRVDYGVRLHPQLRAGHSELTQKSAHLVEDNIHKQWLVTVPGWTGPRPASDYRRAPGAMPTNAPENRPANVPLWLEFGTRFMTAKPALRPAAWAESTRYRTNMAKAAEEFAALMLEL